MSGHSAEVRVLAFPDFDQRQKLSRTLIDDLAEGLPPEVCEVIDWTASPRNPTANADRLVCVGVGAGARAALAEGQRLGAHVILAWAPGGGPLEVPDCLEPAEASTTPRADQSIRVISAPDTVAADFELVSGLRSSGAKLRVEHADVPYEALAIALRLSGQMRAAVAAALDGALPAKPHELAAAWRRSLAHEVEVDLAGSYVDVGGVIHIPGAFRNRSAAAVDLTRLRDEGVGIGGRIGGVDGEFIAEVRSAFSMPSISPGEAAPFRLRLPQAVAERPAELRIGLVCEQRFWFDSFGFPATCLTLGAPAAGGA